MRERGTRAKMADWTPHHELPQLSLARCGCDPEPLRTAARELAGQRILPGLPDDVVVRVKVAETRSCKWQFEFRAVNRLEKEAAFHLLHLLHHLSEVIFRSEKVSIGRQNSSPILNPALLGQLSRIQGAGSRPFRRLLLHHVFILNDREQLNIDTRLAAMQKFLYTHAVHCAIMSREVRYIQQVLNIISGRGQAVTEEIRQLAIYLNEPDIAAGLFNRLIEVRVY
jgi:hypothetical protein